MFTAEPHAPQPTPGERRRLSANEAALRIRASRERLLRLVQTGQLAGGQEGGRWWVDESSVERFLSERTAVPA